MTHVRGVFHILCFLLVKKISFPFPQQSVQKSIGIEKYQPRAGRRRVHGVDDCLAQFSVLRFNIDMRQIQYQGETLLPSPLPPGIR